MKMSQLQRGMRGVDQQADQDGAVMNILSQIAFMQPDKALLYAEKHEHEISSLKQQLNEKEVEIADLRQKLKAVLEKNNDLQIKLDTKDEEVSELKERIQTLEEEKKELQDELSRVESKLKRLESEIKNLSKCSKSQEEENRKLKEDLKRVEFNLKETESNLSAENEKLKNEVKQLVKTRVPVLPPMIEPPSRIPIQQSEQSISLLNLGELCCQIQRFMYEKVLPKHLVSPLRSKIKNIDKDVKKLIKSEEERDAAKERWEKLKSKLNWNEDMKEAIESLQESRNIEAHPHINEIKLKESVSVLESVGYLKGWLSHDRVMELIDIWKRLSSENTDETHPF